MTAEQYDGLMAAMGLAEKGAIGALGAVAHIAGPKEGGGWRVVDVWDTEEAANAFYASDTFAPVRAAAEGGGITTRLGRCTASKPDGWATLVVLSV